ncbi:hypothetical protein GCM10011408_26720 [Dyella caseinilytica]|nr:hypothetical protein GCM10011408_26720 [Dyella caseinilytica]
MWLCLLLVPGCLMIATPAGSQGTKAADSPVAVNGKAPAEMSKLYPRIGHWQVIIRTLPGTGLPQGGIDKGVATITSGPGGYSVVQDFSSHGDGGDEVGQSYTWWDVSSKSYKSVWCDNQQGCSEFTTVIEGSSWSTELDGVADGKKVHTTIRASMTSDHNCIHEEVTASYDGSPPRTETVSEYQRVIPGVGQDKQPSCKK